MAESRSDSIDRMLRELKAQIEQLKAGVDRFTTDSRKHRENEKDGRTLFIKIHRENFPISWEELERVFSRFGMVEYTEILIPGGNYHSKVRFQNRDSTIRAFDAMNHRDIYDGCCRMELSIDAQTGSRTSEIETPMGAEQLISCDSTVVEGLEVFQDEIKASNEEVDSITQVIEHFMGNPLKVCEEGEALDQEIKHITKPIEEPCQETESEVFSESLMASMRMVVVGLKADESKKSPEAQFESSKVLSCFTNAIVFEEESESMVESAEVEVPIETELVDFWNAYNLFDEMPKRSINVLGSGSWNFDPEGVRRQDCMCWDIVVDRALMRENASSSSCVATIADRGLAVNLIFDPGIWESCTEPGGVKSRDYKIDDEKICFPKLLRGSLLFQLSIVGHTKAMLTEMGMRTRVFVIVNLGIIPLVYDPGGLVVESHNGMGVEGSDYIEHHICNKSSKPDNPWIGWCTAELENVGCMGFYGFCGCAQDGCNELINIWNNIEVVANSQDLARAYAFHGKMVELVSMPFNRGRVGRSGLGDALRVTKQGLPTSYVFDPGGGCASTGMCNGVANNVKLVFDPGIPKWANWCYKSVCAAEMSNFCQVAVHQLMVE